MYSRVSCVDPCFCAWFCFYAASAALDAMFACPSSIVSPQMVNMLRARKAAQLEAERKAKKDKEEGEGEGEGEVEGEGKEGDGEEGEEDAGS